MTRGLVYAVEAHDGLLDRSSRASGLTGWVGFHSSRRVRCREVGYRPPAPASRVAQAERWVVRVAGVEAAAPPFVQPWECSSCPLSVSARWQPSGVPPPPPPPPLTRRMSRGWEAAPSIEAMGRQEDDAQPPINWIETSIQRVEGCSRVCVWGVGGVTDNSRDGLQDFRSTCYGFPRTSEVVLRGKGRGSSQGWVWEASGPTLTPSSKALFASRDPEIDARPQKRRDAVVLKTRRSQESFCPIPRTWL